MITFLPPEFIALVGKKYCTGRWKTRTRPFYDLGDYDEVLMRLQDGCDDYYRTLPITYEEKPHHGAHIENK